MANPIEPTPPLDGEDAERFLEAMRQGVPVSPERVEQAKRFVAEVENGKPIPLKLPKVRSTPPDAIDESLESRY